MKVLVTGGTGVVGEGVVPALLAAGHSVRLLSRHAGGEAGRWSREVEAFPADVGDPGAVEGAAEGCGAVLHIAGIVQETGGATFQAVNEEGTRNVLAEATRAGARRFVFLSSLGVERGASAYHRSKRAAEALVQATDLEWVILRSGNVYGPGDQVISLLVRLVRSLPALPVIAHGGHRFQPIWFEDLGRAAAAAVEREDVVRAVHELAGPQQTSLNDLLQRLGALTGRRPLKVPVPTALARLATRAAAFARVGTPVSEAQLQMLEEENVSARGHNVLVSLFGVPPTPLDEGLQRLLMLLPEQLPGEGVGPLVRKTYTAEIDGSALSARDLREAFRRDAARVLPLGLHQLGRPRALLRAGSQFSLAQRGRGDLPMRVLEVGPTWLTAATVSGHPLAGAVTFRFEETDGGLRFRVVAEYRAADRIDQVLMATVGGLLQDYNWVEVARRMVALSGGTNRGGVALRTDYLEPEEAAEVEARLAEIVRLRHRGRTPAAAPLRRQRLGVAARASTRPGSRPLPSGAGSAPRSRGDSGSGRTSGRTPRPGASRKGS